MTYVLVVEPEAESEIKEAWRWYSTVASELGDDFLSAIEEALASIQENPYQYQIIYRNGRRARLRRFPYRLIYVVTERELVVLACIHSRRDPKVWQERT